MSERYSLLPTNASALERAFERAFAELLEEVDPPFPELLDPTRTPVSALPYLAQDRGVVEWEGDASETLKRRTVQNVWPIRRLAGTRAGLVLAVDELALVVGEEESRGDVEALLGRTASEQQGEEGHGGLRGESTPQHAGRCPEPRPASER